jgi:hypothetical protein
MTDTFTDIDDLKQAWQQLDRRLERQQALNIQQLRDGRMSQVRRALRPLRWGQVLQIPLGAVVVLLSVASWRWRWDILSVRIAAMVMHAYGIALIVASAHTLALLGRVEYGAPVLEIQRRLADLQRWYGLSGLVLGMAWWLLWLPALVMMGGVARIDLLARAPWVLLAYATVCLVGLGLSLWLVRWAERSSRPAVRAWAERAAAGASLYHARAALDEIHRFEQEVS